MNNEPQPWISVYGASIALECTPNEVQQRINTGDIEAIKATKKRQVYWKIIDAKAIKAFRELNMEIMYPYRRTERFSRYCDCWINDDIKACAARTTKNINNEN